MKAFLFVFDQSRLSNDDAIRKIDRISEIANWYALFGNTMCLASDLNISTLSKILRDAFPDLRFIITEVDREHKAGWMPKEVWSFLNDPQPAEKESV